MRCWYNEIDAYAADWLRNLVTTGLIPFGHIDTRSILKVEPDDIRPFRQCHFFAGIGGWPFALTLADWPDDREVWTASCPCQPLSSAGQRQGHADERHLWPAFYRLVAECRPATIFGEQVASKDGREWLAGIRADLEHLGYAVGCADLPAASVGAPHIRQRLFWVAHAHQRGWGSGGITERQVGAEGEAQQRQRLWADPDTGGSVASGLGDAAGEGRHRLAQRPEFEGTQGLQFGGPSARGFWDGAAWLPCLDGKARRIEPGTFPLADGIPARVGRLRAYGNAIVPQAAAEFIRAFLETA